MSTPNPGIPSLQRRRPAWNQEHPAMAHPRFGRPGRATRFLGTWLATTMLVASHVLVPAAQAAQVPAAAPAAPAAAPAALVNPTSTITLNVTSARAEPLAPDGTGSAPVTKGQAVTSFKYLINIDNTGTTDQKPNPTTGALPAACTPADPSYPANCLWPSIAGLSSSSPVLTQGTEADFPLTLPAGRYLISVLADGYKLDGAHVTIPMESPGVVDVELQPTPVPTATIQAQVFADVSQANGQFDPGENGLAGFHAQLNDTLGTVSTDVFGNPLCTTYQKGAGPNGYLWQDGAPVVDQVGHGCYSTADGNLTIPNVGTNRYALSVIPPNGTTWIQTTTLEGTHDWDAWAQEGQTGLDTEFIVGGEPFPAIIFGFVPGPDQAFQADGCPATGSYWACNPHKLPSGGTGEITGIVDALKAYVPPKGGIQGEPGIQGARIDAPIAHAWVVLNDLQRGDTAVWVGQADKDGKFDIKNVPPGNYNLTYWDEPQNYILATQDVTVGDGPSGTGETVDMGVLGLLGWWTKLDGYVFNDANGNGIKDPGEKGVPNFTLTLRRRDNSLMDRGGTAFTTDQSGYYHFDNGYPMTQWLVLEAFDTRFYTTGITYRADNQSDPTTVLGSGVDVSVLPIIGLGGRVDWGVRPYDKTGATGPKNGGIVGTVSYDTTRNELDPRFAAVEDWQPGVPNLPVDLYAPVDCPADGSAPCDPSGKYQVDADGSLTRGNLLNTYTTETWQRPVGADSPTQCLARDVNNAVLQHGIDENVLPTNDNGPCIEAPLMGVQVGPYGTDLGTPNENFGAAVDGNYGFGDGCQNPAAPFDPNTGKCTDGSDPTPLAANDYLVKVEIPTEGDLYPNAVHPNRPLYQVTREEDINIGNGDTFVPQVAPPVCAGALHTVDVASTDAAPTTDNYPALVGDGTNGEPVGVIVPASAPVDNPTFANDVGGSPYEGTPKPLCDTKLVELQNGSSIAPTFNVFTDVPVAGRFFGLIVDDLNFSTDPKSIFYGEKAGVPFAPVGVYDFTDRLVTTVESDYNGIFDLLLPSTNRINCPTPSGVCANVYRFVGNDPGVPGHLNANYNPQYRTIAADFEALPGVVVPADVAPTQVGVSVQLPGQQTNQAVSCPINPTAPASKPELFAVSRPFVRSTGSRQFTINGQGFGAPQGTGRVTLGTTLLTVNSWSDTRIVVTVPATSTSFPPGPYQLTVTGAGGASTVDGLTFHVLGTGYNPNVYEVGLAAGDRTTAYAAYGWPAITVARYQTHNSLPGSANHAIQNALNDAAASSGTDLVIVYPGLTSADPRVNPRGAYYENLIINAPVKLQGVGPGGVQLATNTTVPGSIIDAGAFAGDSPVATDWYATIGGLTWDGNQDVFDGAGISIYAQATGGRAFGSAYKAAIDGFDLRGGDQQGFPGNINQTGGGPTGAPAGVVTQGGAIYANAYARNLQITNNVVQNNGGAYGTIRIGNPDLPAPDTSNHNDNVRIANNRIVANAGTNLAGAIGIFAGAYGYEVANNDICGNFSAEYGGGVSVYGLSDTFPVTGVLDSFNRANGNLGANWADGNANGTYRIDGNNVQVRNTGNNVWTANTTPWASFGPNQEAYFTFRAVATNAAVTQQGLLLKFTGPGFAANNSTFIAVAYNRSANTVEVRTKDATQGQNVSTLRGTITAAQVGTPFGAGDQLGARAVGNVVTVFKNGKQIGSPVEIPISGSGSSPWAAAGGSIGVRFAGTTSTFFARFDDFGGGSYALPAIHDNRITFNRSYDEGGGVIVAGELPVDPTILSPGSGPVDIFNNLIEGNLGGDDGGGLRFLMAGNSPFNVYNNLIVNNVSSHEGGGISLNDAPNVRFFNNTVMKNITTATAITSNGAAAPAGLATSANSLLLQPTLPAGSPSYSNPLLFNNTFWDNRAGSYSPTTGETGIGAAGDATPINNWDMGVADSATDLLSPTNSILQTTDGTVASPSNIAADPLVVTAYDLGLSFAVWRGNVNFIGSVLVVADIPTGGSLGNYHLQSGSPAVDAGASAKGAPAYQQPPAVLSAPSFDFDRQARPLGAGIDIGADEVR
jgi:hypothetical protein